MLKVSEYLRKHGVLDLVIVAIAGENWPTSGGVDIIIQIRLVFTSGCDHLQAGYFNSGTVNIWNADHQLTADLYNSSCISQRLD